MIAVIILVFTAIVLNGETMAERSTPQSFDIQYQELVDDTFQNEEKLKRIKKYNGGGIWDKNADADPCNDDTRRIPIKKALSALGTNLRICEETNRGVLAKLCNHWSHNLYDKYLGKEIPYNQ